MIEYCKSPLLRLSLLISLALPFFQSACAPATPRVSGTDIVLTYATGPVIKASEELDVFITNTSQGCINFPDDFGLRIFYRQNGSWVETGNLMKYMPPQNNHLGPHGEPFETTSVSLIPSLSHVQIREPLALKATIRGYSCHDPAAVVEKDIPFTVVP